MDEEQFEIRRANVGEDVTLSCVRDQSERSSLFWTKFVPGRLPDVLGSTFSFNSTRVNNSSHIICEQGPGTFLLRILKVTPNDTGFYYCIQTNPPLTMIIVKGTFLKIQGENEFK